MTAEIAIINRGAVTLATDSAVTLTVRGEEKVYNSADKLFELSNSDPIGIMIYNNLEFMGIPLEVAIKDFRDSHTTGHHFDSISDAAEAFFKYLHDDLSGDLALQKAHAKGILGPALRPIRDDFFETAVKADAAARAAKKGKSTNFASIFTHTVMDHLERVEKLAVSPVFDGISEEEILHIYSATFDDLINTNLRNIPVDVEQRQLLRRFLLLSLTRDEFSESLTGFVFAGFGEHEKFPSLLAFQLDGIIANRLKRKRTDEVKTERSKITGEVIPFAQREMVDRFLYGVDPEFEEGIEEFLKTVIQAAGDGIVGALPRSTKKTKEQLAAAINKASDSALDYWHNKMVPNVKEKFKQEVQDMVFLMPKQELADLAQELINLTSVKRKFSSGRETVGGPIDVAVISRIDGFVWVRRKHYFKPELNPRYFVRKFGTQRLLGGQ